MKDHIDRYFTVAKQLGVDVNLVKNVVESEFEFTANVIKEGKDEPVYLQYLGRFFVKPGKRAFVENRREILKKIKLMWYEKKKQRAGI